MSVLSLTYEHAIFELLDSKTKKVFEFSHHRHLKPIGHDLAELITKGFISRTKNDVINLYLAYI
jgi:hypothetical protein